MDARRLEELLSDIWAYAFAVLDRKPELTAEGARMIATAVDSGLPHQLLIDHNPE